MGRIKWICSIFVLGLNLGLVGSGNSSGQVDFSNYVNKLTSPDASGVAISYFGKFDLYFCNGKRNVSSYAFIVPEKEVHDKVFKTVRWIQFFSDDFVGKNGGGHEDVVRPLNAIDIGERSVYEVLPYDDKVVFVLIDGRAYDVLTFVCNGGELAKISEIVQPDDLDVKPSFPHSH